jgi:hypothetical protein
MPLFTVGSTTLKDSQKQYLQELGYKAASSLGEKTASSLGEKTASSSEEKITHATKPEKSEHFTIAWTKELGVLQREVMKVYVCMIENCDDYPTDYLNQKA